VSRSRGRSAAEPPCGVGQAGEAFEPAGQDAAHQTARRDDLRVGKAVADDATGAVGLDDAGRTHDREMLRCIRLADAEVARDPADLDRTAGQAMDDPEPAGMGQRSHDLGLEGVDLVHGPSIDPCAYEHQCHVGRRCGPDGPAGPPPERRADAEREDAARAERGRRLPASSDGPSPRAADVPPRRGAPAGISGSR